MKMCKVIPFPKQNGKYQIGQRIYYRGDMANREGWFEIVAVYDRKYDLQEINGDRLLRCIYECGISEVDKGNGSTRFVTEEAYKAYRNEQMKRLEESLNKIRQKPSADVIKTDTILKNGFCRIELNGKDVSGRDLTDGYNEPSFYNQTSRSIKKAWDALVKAFDAETRMYDAMGILQTNGVRCRSYCAMD
jgi:hypothetical protein